MRSIRFIECEKWRKEFGTDEICRTFEYHEKAEVFKFYPQYYHKTDKVRVSLYRSNCLLVTWTMD